MQALVGDIWPLRKIRHHRKEHDWTKAAGQHPQIALLIAGLVAPGVQCCRHRGL